MTPDDLPPIPELSPEEQAAIFAEMKKSFTADDLYGYITDSGEKFPIEQVILEAEAIMAEIRARKEREARS